MIHEYDIQGMFIINFFTFTLNIMGNIRRE